jgi:hypothetical protein
MEIVVNHAREMDHALNAGVRELQALALAGGGAGGGILVTKHAPGRFTLELSHDVPFGYTHEKRR